MLSYGSMESRTRKSILRTSAAATLLACVSHAACAQDTTKQSSPTPTAASSVSNDATGQSSNDVDQVIVTGTNIKGAKPIDPVVIITRTDIDESGYATIGDVMRSLPEDFSGGQNPGNFVSASATGQFNYNTTNGSTVDLFGLGSDATLTLVNGQRLSTDGIGGAPNISVIPLAAVQRVEVVTDGSSAIYGSDAVAGVVNFILRKDYDGLEASAYYGGATEGGGETQTYSMLAGISRDRWHILVSAEYQNESPITASERAFTANAYGPDTLIQGQTSKSLLLSAGLDITDKISFSVDGIYNDLESGGSYGHVGLYSVNAQSITPSYSINATLGIKLPRDWSLSLVGTLAESYNEVDEQEIVAGTSYPAATTYRNNTHSMEGTASGTLITIPMGPVHVAVGGGYRQEGFDEYYPGIPDDQNVIHASRNSTFVYGEALVPLISSSASRTGLESLEFSASGRFEHYSDFGDTANPKLGLRYTPFNGLTLRGSWGTSFKAPLFLQQYEAVGGYVEPAAYWGYPGNALEVDDGNPKLKPERSRNWTIGGEYSPPNLRSLVISFTYFNIDYKNRIVNPLTGVSAIDQVTDPAYAPFVIKDPAASLVQNEIASIPQLVNYTGGAYNNSSINLIVDDQFQNALSQFDNGIDLSYRQIFSTNFGNIRTFANATWSHLTQQLTANAPVETISGTIFQVPTFKTRIGASWSKYGLTATAIANYTSGERDTVVTPSRAVGSMTTVDANLTYNFPDSGGIRHGLALALSVTNLFDRAPPYANPDSSLATGIYYDSLNASAIGRFVAFKVTKKW